jgi:ankyrin repeat protein
VNSYEETPLILAAKNAHTAVVKILLKHGADTSLLDAEGKSALQYAEAAGHKEISELLKKNPSKQ